MSKLLFFILCIFFLSCKKSDTRKAGDLLVADAFGQHLYLSDIAHTLHGHMSKQDSQLMIHKESENWIMQKILVQEANKKIKDKSEIEDLVLDYKNALYIKALEDYYVSEALDTSITQAQMDSFYADHKEEFKLSESLLRFILVKVPVGKDNDTLNGYWETEDIPGLNYFAHINEGIALLQLNKWYYVSELKTILPKKIFESIDLKDPKAYSDDDGTSKFYVKVLEIIKNSEEAPVSFIAERIRQRILQQRIKKVLYEKKTLLYDEKIKSKGISIHSKLEK